VALGIDDIFIGIADTGFAAYVGARMALASSRKQRFVVPAKLLILISPTLSLLDSPAVTSLLERVLSTLGMSKLV
jgi:hypothetical protein